MTKEYLNLIIPVCIPFTMEEHTGEILREKINKENTEKESFNKITKQFPLLLQRATKHLFEDLNSQMDVIQEESTVEPFLSISPTQHELKVYSIFIGERPYEFYFSKEKAEEKAKYLIAPDVKIFEIPYAFSS